MNYFIMCLYRVSGIGSHISCYLNKTCFALCGLAVYSIEFLKLSPPMYYVESSTCYRPPNKEGYEWTGLHIVLFH